MTKRIIGLVLALCLIVGLLPMIALAEEPHTHTPGETYTVKSQENASLSATATVYGKYVVEYTCADCGQTYTEDVAFGPENLGIASPEIRRRVDQALQQVGMSHFAQHAPHLLSGGQKQRIAIAGVIAMQPKCIVLDEPTAMLDPRGRREVVDTVSRLNKEKGITVVLITHHMDEAAKADRVVVLHKGRVAADGSPKEVFNQVELLHSIGLAAPETTELCWELNKHGFDLPLDALSEEECARAIYQEVAK